MLEWATSRLGPFWDKPWPFDGMRPLMSPVRMVTIGFAAPVVPLARFVSPLIYL
jgi:hypothetical protein